MANIARGKAECYISIKAECRVLYFMYSMWQGNNLSVLKNHSPQLNIPSLPTWTTNYIKSAQNWICSNTLATVLSSAERAKKNLLKAFRFFVIRVSGSIKE